MNRKILILFLIVLSSSLKSQSIVFNEIYDSGDSLYNGCDFVMEIENSGNYLMQSQFFSASSPVVNNGMQLIEIDVYGNVINRVSIKKDNSIMIGNGILEHRNHYYTTNAVVDPNENNRFDTYIVKYNRNLDTIYTKLIDIGYHDSGHNLKSVSKNKLIFLSYYYPDSTIYENRQIVMVTIDTLGNILDQWEYGGPSFDAAYDYKQTNDGGYIIGGSTKDSINDDADLFLLKIDSNGTEEWYHKYGTVYEEAVRAWNYMETIADGGYIIAAEEQIITPFGTQNIVRGILIKTDENGLELWKKKYT